MFMHLLETANIMFLSFVRFELLSFEHGNPISNKLWNVILWLFCYGTFKFSLLIGTGFPSHLFSTHFVHICKASLVFIGNT